MQKLIPKLINPSSLYVLINILVSAVGFTRSFLFMKGLDMNELGIISLVQTVIMFMGLFQLGLLNGGYRIFALDKADEQRSINNVLFSYFALIGGIALCFWAILVVTNTQIVINNTLMLVALVCGISTLVMNWLTNTLIGKRLIKSINQINLIAAFVSLALLPLVMVWGITGAIIALFAQPLIFISITLIKHKDLRPSAWNFDLKLIKYILSFGFIPFLTGITAIINLQIERWSIADILGTEALGEFYLIFLYTTLFVLIPSSLNSLFFPKAVKAYEDRDMALFRLNLKRYTTVIVGYLTVVALMTLLLLQPVVDLVFPQHSGNTIYVLYFLPGLAIYALCDPIGLVMNSMVKLRPMLLAGIASIVVNILLIIITNHLHLFSLTAMAFIKDAVNFVTFVVYFGFFIKIYKHIFSNDTKQHN